MENIFTTVSLQEFDHEIATARKMLERVPFEEKKDWKPHDKSTPMGRLATHIARLPEMVVNVITKDSLTFGPGGSGARANVKVENTTELLALFDETSKEARAALADTNDAHFAGEWKLAFDDGTNTRQIFKGSRSLAYRSLFIDHFVHHRAQLGVYLRLNDIAIPGSYGPSADEAM